MSTDLRSALINGGRWIGSTWHWWWWRVPEIRPRPGKGLYPRRQWHCSQCQDAVPPVSCKSHARHSQPTLFLTVLWQLVARFRSTDTDYDSEGLAWRMAILRSNDEVNWPPYNSLFHAGYKLCEFMTLLLVWNVVF